MDYRSFGFCELLRSHSEEDGGLQCSIITPALRRAFNSIAFRYTVFLFRTPATPEMLMIENGTRGRVVSVCHSLEEMDTSSDISG